MGGGGWNSSGLSVWLRKGADESFPVKMSSWLVCGTPPEAWECFLKGSLRNATWWTWLPPPAGSADPTGGKRSRVTGRMEALQPPLGGDCTCGFGAHSAVVDRPYWLSAEASAGVQGRTGGGTLACPLSPSCCLGCVLMDRPQEDSGKTRIRLQSFSLGVKAEKTNQSSTSLCPWSPGD